MSSAKISESYRRLQADLHASNSLYGRASADYAPMVAQIITGARVTEMLDYGAGKGLLGQALKSILPTPPPIHHYEPAIPEWAGEPAPSDFVVCIDVLEHVEPECLDAVLDDLVRVTKRIGFFSVHCGPAKKTLADGRNAHLTQQPANWWLPRLLTRFDLSQFSRGPTGFWVTVEPLPTTPRVIAPVES